VARQHEALLKSGQLQSISYYAESFLRMYRLLTNEAADADAWKGELEAARQELAGSHDHGMPVFWATWIMVLCFLRQYEAAGALADEIAKTIFVKGVPGSIIVDFTMFRGVASAVRAGAAAGGVRRRQLRVARRCARQLRAWEPYNPDFPHMSLFLEAECARAAFDDVRALSLYRDAARRARKQGYIHHAALVHERRADLLLAQRRGIEATGELKEAISLYGSWGAAAKLRELKEVERAARGAVR
jgi:hypothetical protein